MFSQTVCDVCDKPMKRGDGYVVNTETVVTSEAYWSFTLTHQWYAYRKSDPTGSSLKDLVAMQAGQATGWLICESCSHLFFFDRSSARRHAQSNSQPPGVGATDVLRSLSVARRAWDKVDVSTPLGDSDDQVVLAALTKFQMQLSAHPDQMAANARAPKVLRSPGTTRLSTKCPKCGTKVIGSQKLRGKPVQCPRCSHQFSFSNAHEKITAQCPHCRKRLSAGIQLGGRLVKCPSCQQAFRVKAVRKVDSGQLPSPQKKTADHANTGQLLWCFECGECTEPSGSAVVSRGQPCPSCNSKLTAAIQAHEVDSIPTANSLVSKGERFYRSGKHVRALESFSKAAEIRDDLPHVLLNTGNSLCMIAWTNQNLGEFQRGTETLRACLDLYPSFELALTNLDVALRTLAEWKKAASEERTEGKEILDPLPCPPHSRLGRVIRVEEHNHMLEDFVSTRIPDILVPLAGENATRGMTSEGRLLWLELCLGGSWGSGPKKPRKGCSEGEAKKLVLAIRTRLCDKAESQEAYDAFTRRHRRSLLRLFYCLAKDEGGSNLSWRGFLENLDCTEGRALFEALPWGRKVPGALRLTPPSLGGSKKTLAFGCAPFACLAMCFVCVVSLLTIGAN